MRARGRPRTHKPPGTARHGHGAGADPRWQRRHLRTFKAAHCLTQGPLEGLPLWLDAEAGPCGPSWGDLGDTPINRPDRVQTGRDSVPGFVQRAERAARSEAVSEGQTAMLGQGTGDPGRGTAEAGRACSGTREGGGGVGACSSWPALPAASPHTPRSPSQETRPEESGGCLSQCPQRPGCISVPHPPGARLASPAPPCQSGKAGPRGREGRGRRQAHLCPPSSRLSAPWPVQGRGKGSRRQEQEAPSPLLQGRLVGEGGAAGEGGAQQVAAPFLGGPAGQWPEASVCMRKAFGAGPSWKHTPSPPGLGEEPGSPEGPWLLWGGDAGEWDPVLCSRGRPPWRPLAPALPPFRRMSKGGGDVWPRPPRPPRPDHECQRPSV